MKPMIHSKKHFVQVSRTTIAASALLATDIISTVAIEDVNTVSEVIEGASVKAVYVEMWFVSDSDTVPTNMIMTLEKLPLDGNPATTTEMAALGDYNNKKNVFYTTQGLVNGRLANATPFFRGWLKIPKSKQRFGLGDSLVMTIFVQGAAACDICGFFTYKEYT